MFIVSPLRGGGIASLFSTHPPMAERIKRLEELRSF
jgi:heat shock protein HtpX